MDITPPDNEAVLVRNEESEMQIIKYTELDHSPSPSLQDMTKTMSNFTLEDDYSDDKMDYTHSEQLNIDHWWQMADHPGAEWMEMTSYSPGVLEKCIELQQQGHEPEKIDFEKTVCLGGSDLQMTFWACMLKNLSSSAQSWVQDPLCAS